jgi:hypothetical protein
MPASKVTALGLALCVFSLPGPSAGADSKAAPACNAAVQKGSLPTWARDGFHPRTSRVPHVLGQSKNIVAILFAYPLEAPPPFDRNNKILWVSRVPFTWRANLRISAQRMSGIRAIGSPIQRTVKGGPGPSIINLPASGCWRLSLRWAGHADDLDVQYRPRP